MRSEDYWEEEQKIDRIYKVCIWIWCILPFVIAVCFNFLPDKTVGKPTYFLVTVLLIVAMHTYFFATVSLKVYVFDVQSSSLKCRFIVLNCISVLGTVLLSLVLLLLNWL